MIITHASYDHRANILTLHVALFKDLGISFLPDILCLAYFQSAIYIRAPDSMLAPN